MKKTKIISVIISAMILLSTLCINVSAAAFPPKESAVWTNLTDKEADELLNSKNKSFIFCFYRDSCYNSKSSITNFISYAEKNNLTLCGLNTTEYPNWYTWARYLKEGQNMIGFPLVIIYNAKKDILVSDDTVLTNKEFEDLLKQADLLSSGDKSKKGVFSDVDKNNTYYEAIKSLVDDGVLSGYEDGTFKPNNSISRAEAAVVMVKANGLKLNNARKSTYKDVANNYWGKDYIMAASDAGIIKGMGNNEFAPTKNVTRTQIIKMIVCMAGLEKSAIDNGGWPNGYIKTAYNNKIIDATTYNKIVQGKYGDEAATRGQVAQWTYSARRATSGNAFKIAGKVYELGMNADELGTPDETWPSVNRFVWHIFGINTYENFFAAGVVDGKVVALVSTGPAFEYKGYRAGQKLNDSVENPGEFLIDKNDDNIIHGVFLLDKAYNKVSYINAASLHGESKMNFHCTNGFRLYHKMPLYKWDQSISEIARLHSVDMANNNYFDHVNLEGKNPGERIRAGGINWSSYAENIAAGRWLGVSSYDGWVNSSGHRKNLLGNCTYLGVGFAYNENSTYKFYSTQNFYSRISAFDTFN